MQHHKPILFETIAEETWMGKIILLWKTFNLLLKGNWLTVFTIDALRGLCNHYGFTKPNI
jgi:hypothetical protein